jgi:hypothetical protein
VVRLYNAGAGGHCVVGSTIRLLPSHLGGDLARTLTLMMRSRSRFGTRLFHLRLSYFSDRVARHGASMGMVRVARRQNEPLMAQGQTRACQMSL